MCALWTAVKAEERKVHSKKKEMGFFVWYSYFPPSLGAKNLGLVHCAFHQIASSESIVRIFNKVINRK